jgi:hypothetical protein
MRHPQEQERLAKRERVMVQADRAVANAEREQAWPSRVVEAYPRGTFAPSPVRLRAARGAYARPPGIRSAQQQAQHMHEGGSYDDSGLLGSSWEAGRGGLGGADALAGTEALQVQHQEQVASRRSTDSLLDATY